MTAPVVLFVYNRPAHTRRAIEALLTNPSASETELFIFSDAAKTLAQEAAVAEVRAFVRRVTGFRSVSIEEYPINRGLAASVIGGVTKVVERYGRVIVLEDDLIVSQYFLQYMNDALEIYASETHVSAIHGYMFPITAELPDTFFLKDPGCWGWATWQRSWKDFEADGQKLLDQVMARKAEREFNFEDSFDYLEMLKSQIRGENSSWAIRWYASNFLLDKLALYPGKSLVDNTGHDASGTHSGATEKFRVQLASRPVRVGRLEVRECSKVRGLFIHYLRSIRESSLRRGARYLKSTLKRIFGVRHVPAA